MPVTAAAGAAIIAVAVYLVAHGREVRLTLLLAALALGVLGDAAGVGVGGTHLVVREFLGTFSNEKFVVPICSAMGFAYVLRHTGCERHLVLLLVRPLRKVRALIVPGVVVVGFLVNIPVISQSSTAVCIGPVIVPLMRAAGYSPLTVGASLLLGASVGGELMNPGAPELLTVADRTGVSTIKQARDYLPRLVFVQLAVSTLVFWWMTHRRERSAETEPPADLVADSAVESVDRVNFVKALVPLVPLALLFSAGPPLDLFDVPQTYVVNRPPESASMAAAGPALTVVAESKKNTLYPSRLIGLAMLIGVVAAALASPGKAAACPKAFFDGAGYGYANVVSLIVVANCFGKGIESVGLAAVLGDLIAAAPGLMQPLAGLVPLAFAAVSGSGMASTQSLYGFFHEPAVRLGLDPVAVGALVSLGAAAGRTMSPVAAVCLMCGTLTGTSPFALARRVAGPLLVGMLSVIGLRVAGVL